MGRHKHRVGVNRRTRPMNDLSMSLGEILPCNPVQPKALTLLSQSTRNAAVPSVMITVAGSRASGWHVSSTFCIIWHICNFLQPFAVLYPLIFNQIHPWPTGLLGLTFTFFKGAVLIPCLCHRFTLVSVSVSWVGSDLLPRIRLCSEKAVKCSQ